MTSKSRTHGKNAFNDSWLNDERFRLWVKTGRDCSIYIILVSYGPNRVHTAQSRPKLLKIKLSC